MNVRKRRDPRAVAKGKQIAAFRNEAGLTQEELAERSHLSLRTIQSIEEGLRYPRSTTLEKLAKGLKVRPDRLY